MINYSVIIPHYNSLDVLPRAIDSIPERDDIEILVVDNSSTPINSKLFPSRKNVHIYYSRNGQGAGAARNIGLLHAKGRWLLFLDADDFFMENAFLSFDKYINYNSDIIFFKEISCMSDTLELSNRHLSYNTLVDSFLSAKGKKEEDDLRYRWGSPWGKMIRSELVQQHTIKFDETMASNDVMFSFFTGFYAQEIEASTDVTYCITTHEGSLTSTPSMNNLVSRVIVFARYNRYISQYRLPACYKKSVMIYIYTAYKEHGIRQAISLFFLSLRHGNNPFIGATRWGRTVGLSRKTE